MTKCLRLLVALIAMGIAPSLFAGEVSPTSRQALAVPDSTPLARPTHTRTHLEETNRKVRQAFPFNWEKGMKRNYRVGAKLHKLWLKRGEPKPSRYLRAILWADPETESVGITAGFKF